MRRLAMSPAEARAIGGARNAAFEALFAADDAKRAAATLPSARMSCSMARTVRLSARGKAVILRTLEDGA